MTVRLPVLIDVQTVGSVLATDVGFCQTIEGVDCAPTAIHLAGAQANAALASIAQRFYAAGRLKAWRNELLDVAALPAQLLDAGFALDDLPTPLAQVERGAARVLGILTHAVHLVGTTAQGHIVLQRRALNKATDPGLWDTLSGGLLSAGDDLDSGVLRETYEEAGLLPSDLLGLQRCGMTVQQRTLSDGLILEAVWTYRAQLRDGAQAHNLDGEVMDFAALTVDEVSRKVAAGHVTHEAILALRMAGFAFN